MPSSRERLFLSLLQSCRDDDRVVGVIDYGSGGHGRADEWSDIDAAVFLQDGAYDAFVGDWRAWAARLEALLFAYVGRFGHWAMFEGDDMPLRVDLDFIREPEIQQITAWPLAPTSVEQMVLYDGTGGILTSIIRSIVGRVDQPDNRPRAFHAVLGDFWYFSLFCCSKLGRGETWVARIVFHSQVLDNLALLLRLEAGAVDRWEGAHAAIGLENSISDSRRIELEACTPKPGREGLLVALESSCAVAATVSRDVALRLGVEFPERLVAEVSAAIARMRAKEESPIRTGALESDSR